MLSKNNKQLITRMNAKQKQRFGLRKLSIGVASVLLGTTFLIGATAQADTVNDAGSGTEHETALVNNNTTNKLDNQSNQLTLSPVDEANQRSNSNDQLSENEIANNKSVSEPDTEIKNNNDALNNLAINLNETQLNEAATDSKSDINNLDFTGAISGFKKTTQGQSGVNFNAGDTADLTYTIRSAGDTSKLENYYWPVKSHYLAMIPAGFKLNSWSSNFDKDDYQITALGKVGPDGEYVYLIALDKTPYYGIPVSFTSHMQATTDLATYGGHDYHGIAIPALLMAVNDNNLFDSSHAITLGNQTYHVTNCSPFLYGNGGQEIKYTMVPGTTQLSENNYKIEKITSTKDDATGTGNAGYEEIVPTVHLNGSVHEGDYIDFHLGIPYTDNATGKTAYKLYDSNLSSNFKLNNIGTVYNMGTFYRLVFSSAVESLNNPTFELNLRWGSQNNQASLNNNDSVYLYQETNDPSKDHTKFIYTPTNDVTINGQSSASGLQVNGMYIYTTKPISTGNKQIGSASIPSVNRTWNQQGDVAVNTIWSNTQTVSLSPAKTGNEFDIKTTITKDPSNLVKFTFTSADDMKRAIQKNVATLDTQKLANEINGANGMYTDLITTKGKQPKVNVVVTMSTTKDPNDPNKETAIWHVKLANVDSANTAKINLIGSVTTVTATANNFTMPSGINSYDQDIAASQKIHTNTYDGAVTSNEQLLKVLQNLPIALTQVVSYKDGKPNEASGVFGGPWHGSIAYNGDSKVDGGGSATDLVTASIDIRTLDGTNLTPQNLTYQGSTGTVIKFAGLQNVYNALSGYHFIKVVSVKNGTETELPNVDPTELDSISFGTASKNNPTQFIIYVQKDQQKVNATLNFVDDNTNAQDLSSYNTSDSGIDGAPIIFNDVSQSIKTLIGKHYELTKVTETNGDNIINGMNPQSINWMTLFGKYGTSGVTFTIHFDHDTKNVNDSKNVKETVHFVFDDGSKAADDKVQNVTFKRSGSQDLVTNKSTWNAWTPGYSQTISKIASPTINGYTPDSQEISAVTVTPTSNDLVKTVTYTANNQTATIKYIDDTTGKTLFTDQANGKYGETIVFETSPTTQITAYEQQHYVVADNSYTGQPTYQADNKQNDFVVHLKHQTEPAKETKTITETIHYVHTDGSKIHDDHVSNVVFHLTGTKDLVTNQTTWDPIASQQFKMVTSPTIKGYTPDSQEISAVTVTPTSNDLVKTVTYTANNQTATIKYIDDTTGKTLFTDQVNGKYGETIVFKKSPATQITAYEQQHYVVADNSYTGQPTYQADDKYNNFVVHLKHQTEPAKETKTITEIVHYVFDDGSKAADDKVQNVTFKRSGAQDLVTNKSIWNAWTPGNSQTISKLFSPTINGYTPDLQEIVAVTVTPTSNGLVKTVTYRANDQQATITYLDDTTGKTLFTDQANGKYGEIIVFKTSPTTQITAYEQQHYVVVGNSYTGQPTYQADNKQNNFVVHLKHQTEPTKETKTITEIVHYVFDDGSKAADDKVQNVTFKRSGAQDLVTNKSIWNAWTPGNSQTISTIVSPTINGYTPDSQEISAVTVTPTSNDLVKTVTYTANNQTATIKYIDDTTGKTLFTDQANGKYGETIVFKKSPATQITAYEQQHYVVADNSYTGQPTYQADDKYNNFVIHLKHQIEPTKETKTITETVHYVYANGTKAANDYQARIKFERAGTKDLVTNQTIWDNWTPNNSQFADVNSPLITGYTANQLEIAPVLVNAESNNLNITVTYNANAIPTIPVINSHSEVPSSKRNNINNQIPNRKVNVHRDQHLLSDKTVDNSSSVKQKIDNHQQLPQTGDHESIGTIMLSIVTIIAASLLSLIGIKKREL